MFQKYLITGASGFLGRAVIAELKKKNAHIRALVLPNDRLAKELPRDISVTYGDICDDESLARFFLNADNTTCVIHCAGIVSLLSHPGDKIYTVNVFGTENILRHCEKNNVGKLVYVSSVHAIPAKPKGTQITENAVFLPSLAAMVRRLHDTGHGGWWGLLTLAPFFMIGFLLGFAATGRQAISEGTAGILLLASTAASAWVVVLLCLPTQSGSNAHGPEPVAF